MTLFNPEDLQTVFPQATPDSLTDPVLAPYEQVAERYVALETSAGRMALTGGKEDVIGGLLDPTDPDIGGSSLAGLRTTPEGQRTAAAYEHAHETAKTLFGLVGEQPPAIDDRRLVEETRKLQGTFAAYEQLGLQPELVVVPEHHTLTWWVELTKALQDSPHNAGVLKEGGLFVADEVRDNWEALTNPGQEPRTWHVHVVSGAEQPTVTNVTSYGYTDTDGSNQTPSPKLNQLLGALNLPAVPDRTPQPAAATASGSRFGRRHQNPAPTPNTPSPLTQPDLHPTAETYLTLQLNRIVTNETPVDSATYSWLNGELPSGRVPSGLWYPDYGRVFLGWRYAGYLDGGIGVRPSGRG